MVFAGSVTVPSHKMFASRYVSLHLLSPFLLAYQILIFFKIFGTHNTFFKCGKNDINAISTVASTTRSPCLNHRPGSLLTATRTAVEFRNLAIVSLRATDTFILVTVLCLSDNEIRLITSYNRLLMMIIIKDDIKEISPNTNRSY